LNSKRCQGSVSIIYTRLPPPFWGWGVAIGFSPTEAVTPEVARGSVFVRSYQVTPSCRWGDVCHNMRPSILRYGPTPPPQDRVLTSTSVRSLRPHPPTASQAEPAAPANGSPRTLPSRVLFQTVGCPLSLSPPSCRSRHTANFHLCIGLHRLNSILWGESHPIFVRPLLIC